MYRFIFIGLLVFVSFFIVPKSFANTIRIEPAYIDVSLTEKDSEKTFDFFITNNSKEQISLELSTIDFRSTDPYGAIGFLGKEITDYSYALSSFLSFETNSIELDPYERKKVIITVKNRQDLSPGGHYAAIIVRQRNFEDNEKTLISPAVSSLVYLIKAGGERYNLSFKGVSFPKIPIVFSFPATYNLLLQNDGNVHLIPYGRAEITDIFGRLIHKGIINENSIRVLPQARRYIPAYSRKVGLSWPISINKINIVGRDSIDKTKFSYSEYFLYINPIFLGVIIFLPAVFFFRKKYLDRRKKKDA